MATAMIAKGKKKYEAKIKALGGASAYRTCGEKGGMEVAICLKGLKEKLTETDWANRFFTMLKNLASLGNCHEGLVSLSVLSWS